MARHIPDAACRHAGRAAFRERADRAAGRVATASFTQFYNTLAYAQHQLHSTGRLHQGTRETVALDVRLPIDLALTAMPLPQRLLEAPLEVHMRLQEPDLAIVQQWQPAIPQLAGTLQGRVDLQGTYTALSSMSVRNCNSWRSRG